MADPNPNDDNNYDVRITWRTMRASTEEEADQKIQKLHNDGFTPVSFTGTEYAIWGIFKMVQRIPRRIQAEHVQTDSPGQLLG